MVSMAGAGGPAVPYQRGYRRILVDMHIPDWDDAFLARYDPDQMTALYERAHASGVMLYCKSHLGLCYWPTSIGTMHKGLHGRDIVGDGVNGLRSRRMGVCAYYSVVFDNLAVATHPDWRQRSVSGDDLQTASRYGLCCLNNLNYRAYELELLRELLGSYDFDALFLDMVFWRIVCACGWCRERYGAETGQEIPKTIDWTSPDWCRFQTARERWTAELTSELVGAAKAVRPELAVTHNLAPAMGNWTMAQPLSACAHDDFVSGDLYGDPVEQLVVSKAMLHLGATRPPEFMTTRCVGLPDHVRLKSEHQMAAQAMAAAATSAAFLFIDAIDPVGTASPPVYDIIGRCFEKIEPFEDYLGGNPIEDVAVYLSAESQMDFAENGTPLTEVKPPSRTYPHFESVRGACRALQRAHVPFGVITEPRLTELWRFRVVVLANVTRMTPREADAFRQYVKEGGRLYASRHTSLVDSTGVVHDDFMLGDVFGVRYAGEEPGAVVYSRPVDASLAASITPQELLSHAVAVAPYGAIAPLTGFPRLTEEVSGKTLATLTVPYGYPDRGTVTDRRWASIHSSPPWLDLDVPTVVTNDFGSGRVVYSVADLESDDGASEQAFVALIRDLLDERQSFSSEGHPAVWISGFDQSDQHRVVLSFLHYPSDLPPASVPVTFAIQPPAGAMFSHLSTVPDGRTLDLDEGPDGTIRGRLEVVVDLVLVVADYVEAPVATEACSAMASTSVGQI